MWALPGKHTWVLWKNAFGFLCTTSGRNMITPGLKSSERELTFSWSIKIYFPLGLPGYFLVYSPRILCSVQFLHVVFDYVAVFSLMIETVLVFCLFVCFLTKNSRLFKYKWIFIGARWLLSKAWIISGFYSISVGRVRNRGRQTTLEMPPSNSTNDGWGKPATSVFYFCS